MRPWGTIFFSWPLSRTLRVGRYFVTKYLSSNALDRIKSVHVFKIPLSPSVDFIQFIKFRGYIPLGYRTDFSCLYVFVEISKNEDSTDDSIVALLIVFFRLSLNWFHMCLIFSSNSRKLYSFSIFKINNFRVSTISHWSVFYVKFTVTAGSTWRNLPSQPIGIKLNLVQYKYHARDHEVSFRKIKNEKISKITRDLRG